MDFGYKQSNAFTVFLTIALFLCFASCNGGGSNTYSSQSPKEWGIAGLIEVDDTGDADSPQIAINGDGHAIAVWRQSDGTRFNIWANYFDGAAWGPAELIETDDANTEENPQIAVDADGNAIAVWSQSDGTRFSIWANYFNGATWGTASPR